MTHDIILIDQPGRPFDRHRMENQLRCCGGFSSSSGDSSYARKGNSTSSGSHTIPANIADLITSNVTGSKPDPAALAKQTSTYNTIMDRTTESVPGFSNLSVIANQPTTTYPGREQLATAAVRDPYSTVFETATADAYKQRAADAMAQAATGPDAVRGGASQTGIASAVLAERLAKERGYEVRNAQQQDFAQSSDAIKTMNAVENAKIQQSLGASTGLSNMASQNNAIQLQAARGVDVAKMNNMGLLQLAAGIQGSNENTQHDDFTGKGYQSTNQLGGGVSCCFIFLEALNGRLPWYIELAKRKYRTGARRTGYCWMSEWLVPMMQKMPFMKRLVNFFIVTPFLNYGAWLYSDVHRKPYGWLYAPYCWTWLYLWGGLGHFVTTTRGELPAYTITH